VVMLRPAMLLTAIVCVGFVAGMAIHVALR
jgi:hypothetical protein